jgi:hypothetical protein
MNGREKSMAEKRAYNDAIRAAMPPGSKLSGPTPDVFFEGWAHVGWNLPRKTHYWRRRPGDTLLSTCGVRKPVEYTIKGQMMIFEGGNFEKCSKCVQMRQRIRR